MAAPAGPPMGGPMMGGPPSGVQQECMTQFTTLRGEVDKLCSNVSMGRAFAGVHYRSDLVAGWALGERVAVRLLHELVQRYPEKNVLFRFHLRDGTGVEIG